MEKFVTFSLIYAYFCVRVLLFCQLYKRYQMTLVLIKKNEKYHFSLVCTYFFRRVASKLTEQQFFWCVEEYVTVRYLRRHGVKTSRLNGGAYNRNTKIKVIVFNTFE